jgi:hypothetical protein
MIRAQFGSLNHSGLTKRNASAPATVGRLRAEADINLPRPPLNPSTMTQTDKCSLGPLRRKLTSEAETELASWRSAAAA